MEGLNLNAENFGEALDTYMESQAPADGDAGWDSQESEQVEAAVEGATAPSEGEEIGETTEQPEPDAVEAPPEEEKPKPEAQPPSEETAPADEISKEMLDDGAQLRKRGERREWVYSEERGKQVYAGYKTAHAIEQIIQEDPTPAAIQAREDAFRDAEWMRLDLISGDATRQAKVFNHLLMLSANARKRGDVQIDPMPAAAAAFADVLEQNHPEAFRALSQKFSTDIAAETRKFVQNLYQKGLASGNENVVRSAKWIAKEAFGDYGFLDQKPSAPDPNEERERTLREREEAIRRHDQEAMKGTRDQWQKATADRVQSAVDGAVEAILGRDDIKKAYEKFPERLKNIRGRFSQEIRQSIQSDKAWRQANEQLYARAHLAVSDETRQEVAEAVAKRYEAKARRVLDGISKQILSEDVQLLKTQSDSNNQRRANAAERRTPTGASAAPAARIPAKIPDKASRDDWYSRLEAL